MENSSAGIVWYKRPQAKTGKPDNDGNQMEKPGRKRGSVGDREEKFVTGGGKMVEIDLLRITKAMQRKMCMFITFTRTG